MDLSAILGLAGLVLVQFSLLWYKMGRMEAKLESHCRESRQGKEKNGQG